MGTEPFTVSRAKAPAPDRALLELRRDPGIDEPVHTGTDNPMIYFRMPENRPFST